MNNSIQYVKSSGKNIAYYVSGHGAKPLVMINGWVTNLEEMQSLPGLEDWFDDLRTFSKLIVFDKRGVGLSDRVNERELPSLQERIEDIRSILDREQIEKATLFGVSEGGPIALMFAHQYPERVESLILFGSFARWIKGPNYQIGISREIHQKTLEVIETNWGHPIGHHLMAPSLQNSEEFREAWASFLRKSASPGTAQAFYKMNLSIDVRYVLPEIELPVLVLHRKNDRLIPVELGKYIADHLPASTWTPLDGEDHLPWVGNASLVTTGVAAFMNEQFLPHREVLEEGKLQHEDLETLHMIKTYLEANYLEELTIEDLCYRFNINAFKLKYGFKRLFGVPVMQFVREARMKRADSLLRETRLSVKEIAYKMGYQHPESFSKAFNRLYNTSPSQIREQAV